MTYKECVHFLFVELAAYQKLGKKALQFNLNNILAICEQLGHPQKQFKSIHIAGTNGKGSTAHALASILQTNGLKVGLFSSPHYKDIREQIKINGQLIDNQFIIDFVKKNKNFLEKLAPSFFEAMTAMAFAYFAQKKVDIAIIETGLGGRLDATNVVEPILSVITNIGLDHTAFLGDTLPKIAAEKAGIIKKNTPIVIGEYQTETALVFEEKARICESPIFFADKSYTLKNSNIEINKLNFDVYLDKKLLYKALSSDLTGTYQEKNLLTVFQCLEILQKNKLITISLSAIYEGLKAVKVKTNFIGRWHILSPNKPLIILDSAHNLEAWQAVFKTLKKMDFDELHIVFGAVEGKNLEGIFDLFSKNKVFYHWCQPNISRAVSVSKLETLAKQYNLKSSSYKNVTTAFESVKNNIKDFNKKEVVLVGGSCFVVAELL